MKRVRRIWSRQTRVLAALLLCAGACRRDHVPSPASPPNPSYVELYAIQPDRDEQHSTPLVGPDGDTWYRDERPILDLSHCAFDRAQGTRMHGTLGVILPVLTQAHDRVVDWPGVRNGGYLGLVLDGRLISVSQLDGVSVPRIFIAPLADAAEAVEVQDAIRAGGVVQETP